jgi:hypothetical protein
MLEELLMQRTRFIIFLLLVFPLSFLFAQEEAPPEDAPVMAPIESEWEEYSMNTYSRGDKTFTITLGFLIPTFLFGKDIPDNNHGLSLGGTGTLSFNYFFTSHFFLGGEVSGMFMGTRAKNNLFIIPIGPRIGYQFIYRRFEFPLTLMVGWAAHKYLESNYGGLIVKPGASAFWRFNPDWSFGLNALWWFVPQWPKNGYDAYGNFLELTLSARYHF